MSRRVLRALASTSLLVVLPAVSPISAQAQPAGWYLIPSISGSEEFDDNIFGTSSGAESDFITRFSPLLQAGYQSDPLTLLGSGSFDSEVFAENSELTDAFSRIRGGLDLQYLPTRLLTLELNASYTETETGTELLPETGIELGRRRATQVAASPSVSYQFTPRMSGDASYSYSDTRISGGVDNITQRAQLTLTRQLSRVDTGTASYGLSLFDSDGSETTTSHTLTVGWTRRLARDTVIALRGGARLSDEAVSPEASARLARRFKRATVSLAYAQSEAVVVGRPGTVDTQSVSGSVAFEPLKLLEISLAPSFRRSSREEDGSSPDITVYGLSATASYRLTKRISARAAYRFSLQEEGPEEIQRNIFTITLDFATRVRMD